MPLRRKVLCYFCFTSHLFWCQYVCQYVIFHWSERSSRLLKFVLIASQHFKYGQSKTLDIFSTFQLVKSKETMQLFLNSVFSILHKLKLNTSINYKIWTICKTQSNTKHWHTVWAKSMWKTHFHLLYSSRTKQTGLLLWECSEAAECPALRLLWSHFHW